MRPKAPVGSNAKFGGGGGGSGSTPKRRLASWPTPTAELVRLSRVEKISGPLCDSENRVRFWKSWS